MSSSYEYTYQPPLFSFIKHRFNTNPNLVVEATIYSLIIGFLVYILLQIMSNQSIFYSFLIILFFYIMFTSTNKPIKGFFKKVKYVSNNTDLKSYEPPKQAAMSP